MAMKRHIRIHLGIRQAGSNYQNQIQFKKAHQMGLFYTPIRFVRRKPRILSFSIF